MENKVIPDRKKKRFVMGIVSGVVLLALSAIGLYATSWLFPSIAMQYFDPAFDTESSKIILYYLHPFVISFALAWFWGRFKGTLTGSFFTRGIEFGLIYVRIATIPMLWLIYSSMHVSLPMVGTWLILALAQGLISGLIFEKMDP
jgi:hypothetical protein